MAGTGAGTGAGAGAGTGTDAGTGTGAGAGAGFEAGFEAGAGAGPVLARLAGAVFSRRSLSVVTAVTEADFDGATGAVKELGAGAVGTGPSRGNEITSFRFGAV